MVRRFFNLYPKPRGGWSRPPTTMKTKSEGDEDFDDRMKRMVNQWADTMKDFPVRIALYTALLN